MSDLADQLTEYRMSKLHPKALAFAQRIRAELEYEPHSGRLFWKTPRKLASLDYRGASGTFVIVDGQRLSAGRLVWLWHWGEFPPFRLQHMNGCHSDNRIENLGFKDRQNLISGYGFEWDVCREVRGGWLRIATRPSYYEAKLLALGLAQREAAAQAVADLV